MIDVAIIGAGPAGCAAANILADRGFKVIVLEKDKLPRHKHCGGGISLRCVKALNKLDVNIEEVSLQDYKGFTLSYKELMAKSNLGQTIGWGVYRADFDNLLAKSAIYNGARVCQSKVNGFKDENGRIKIFTDSCVRDVQILFGADGIRSTVRKELGIEYKENKIGFCLESEVQATSNNIEEFNDLLHLDFSYLKDGYSWAFPKKQGHTINIGIGGYLKSIQDSGFSLEELLTIFARSHNIPINPDEIHGALLPFGGTVDCFGKSNTILLGDAAGLASPLTGEGIPYALESGIIAANCATKFFEEQIPLVKSYTKAIEPLSREINDYALTLQNRMFGSDAHRRHIVKMCTSNDYFTETVSKIFTHIIPYEEGVKRLSTVRLLPSIIKGGI